MKLKIVKNHISVSDCKSNFSAHHLVRTIVLFSTKSFNAHLMHFIQCALFSLRYLVRNITLLKVRIIQFALFRTYYLVRNNSLLKVRIIQCTFQCASLGLPYLVRIIWFVPFRTYYLVRKISVFKKIALFSAHHLMRIIQCLYQCA